MPGINRGFLFIGIVAVVLISSFPDAFAEFGVGGGPTDGYTRHIVNVQGAGCNAMTTDTYGYCGKKDGPTHTPIYPFRMCLMVIPAEGPIGGCVVEATRCFEQEGISFGVDWNCQFP